ncbi:hypothetical protein HAX54_000442, partial [Datura stramonium]|nr:hypothetical protein [Datura stramonium]
ELILKPQFLSMNVWGAEKVIPAVHGVPHCTTPSSAVSAASRSTMWCIEHPSHRVVRHNQCRIAQQALLRCAGKLEARRGTPRQAHQCYGRCKALFSLGVNTFLTSPLSLAPSPLPVTSHILSLISSPHQSTLSSRLAASGDRPSPSAPPFPQLPIGHHSTHHSSVVSFPHLCDSTCPLQPPPSSLQVTRSRVVTRHSTSSPPPLVSSSLFRSSSTPPSA